MNPDISQYKNYWKQKHTMYGSKCQKCNSLYKLEYYREIVQYYKANFKINPLRLETKKREPCMYSFKYINYKDKHQMDNNNYLFCYILCSSLICLYLWITTCSHSYPIPFLVQIKTISFISDILASTRQLYRYTSLNI